MINVKDKVRAPSRKPTGRSNLGLFLALELEDAERHLNGVDALIDLDLGRSVAADQLAIVSSQEVADNGQHHNLDIGAGLDAHGAAPDFCCEASRKYGLKRETGVIHGDGFQGKLLLVQAPTWPDWWQVWSCWRCRVGVWPHGTECHHHRRGSDVCCTTGR